MDLVAIERQWRESLAGNRELQGLLSSIWRGEPRLGLQRFVKAGVGTSFPIPVPRSDLAY